MTGGGFGGCVIALVPIGRAGPVGEAVRRAVVDAGFEQPVVTRTRAAAGAGLCSERAETYSSGNFVDSAVTTGQKL